jgi:CRP/FNR family transcriptional regulator, cyclic AMP receptor protein
MRLPPWLRWTLDPEQARRVALLARTPIFAGLPRRLLARLGAALFEKAYEPGDVVFREGDPGKGLFIILDGTVAITRATPSGEQDLATLGPGDAFGELALIDDLPRSATAQVTAPTRLLILYRSHFEALVEGDRGVALVVMRNLLRRLASYVRSADRVSPAQAPPLDGDPSSRTPDGLGDPERG